MKKFTFFLAILLSFSACEQTESIEMSLATDIIGLWKATGVYCGDSFQSTFDGFLAEIRDDGTFVTIQGTEPSTLSRDTLSYTLVGDVFTQILPITGAPDLEVSMTVEMPDINTLILWSTTEDPGCVDGNTRFIRLP